MSNEISTVALQECLDLLEKTRLLTVKEPLFLSDRLLINENVRVSSAKIRNYLSDLRESK